MQCKVFICKILSLRSIKIQISTTTSRSHIEPVSNQASITASVISVFPWFSTVPNHHASYNRHPQRFETEVFGDVFTKTAVVAGILRDALAPRVSVVLQCKPVSDCELRKRKSAPPYWASRLVDDLTLRLWSHNRLKTGSAFILHDPTYSQ